MKLKSFYDDLLEWWERHNGSVEHAKNDLNDFINIRMAEAVEINSKNNINKSAYIYKSNVALIISLIFIALCLIPYLTKTKNISSNIIKVEIVNSELTLIQKEGKIMQENDQQTTNDQPDNDPKPVGPPNEEIREDKNIPTTRESSSEE
jgi:hypothetical protein